LNGKKNGRLDIETADALKLLMFEKLTEESNHLLSHWNYGSDLILSKQLPILIQGDLESITEVDKENGIDMKQLKVRIFQKVSSSLSTKCQLSTKLSLK
jgi:hypothetical protein